MTQKYFFRQNKINDRYYSNQFSNYFFRNRRMSIKNSKTIAIPRRLSLLGHPQKTPAKANVRLHLKDIIEVTEDNQPEDVCQTAHIKIDQLIREPQKTIQKINCMEKFTRCIANLWRNFFMKNKHLEINMSQRNLIMAIQRIKNSKTNNTPLLVPQKTPKKVLVLDLDETLVFTTQSKPQKYDYETEVIMNDLKVKIYTIKRFGLDSFLFEMSKIYQIVIFTASQRQYADQIIDQIDPKKSRISHRLYREHCVSLNKSYFLKDLRTLGRNMNETVLVDDNVVSGLLQPNNFYKIRPFIGQEKDRQLFRLSNFLKFLDTKDNFQNIGQQLKNYYNLEIDLEENDFDEKFSTVQRNHLIQIELKKTHKKRNSEIENLVDKQESQLEAQTTASDLIKTASINQM